jgi:hypothetical protein
MGTEIFRSTGRSRALLAFVILFPLLAGCSRNKSGTAEPSSGSLTRTGSVPGLRKTWQLNVQQQPGTVFHVEYSDKTSIVDLATVARTLRGVSPDHRIFVFQDSPELRQKLIPGRCVLFQGLDLRKVDALATYGPNLIVGTETAPLKEALKNANLKWNAPVDFGDLFKQLGASGPEPPAAQTDRLARFFSPTQWPELLEPTVHAEISPLEVEGEVEFSGTDGSKWKDHYHFTHNPDHSMDLDVVLKREAGGLNVDIDIKGHMTRFQQVAEVLMENGSIQHAYFQNVGLHGKVDLDWTVETSEAKTPMNEVRVSLPGKIDIPLAEATELPMSLEVSEALLFHPAFTTKGEVAKGGFTVTYSGDEGFKLEGDNVEQDGQTQGDGAIDSTVAFSPLAAYGLVVAVAAPRVAVKMGTEELWDMAGLKEIAGKLPTWDALADLLMKNTIAGQWLNKNMGNPLAIEGAAYFQVVVSTTAAHSGMQSLVPCQQFTMVAKGQVGLDGEWLGTKKSSPTVDLFSKNIVDRKPNAKICGGG